MKKHYSLQIYGKVQGVWYRASTKKEADKLGVCGWVCNMPDGSVFAEIEGPVNAVEQMVRWCKQGPPLANVEKVELTERSLEGLQTFEIRH